uniref:CCHC-type domain-containing protein n=1 Tax=Tanacetum cinerariifolium TaxID=118510 RepID=A0A699HE41_TANCI|nr:hypothetical protein [Tanacetum cinerariifolium]
MREFHACKQEEGQSNYNMHGMGKTVNELHAMLKLHEDTLPKKDASPKLHAIRAGRVQKNQKNKLHKAAREVMKYNPAKDAICHQCGEIGHWRRNCLVYLVELMKKKKLSQGASTSGSTGNFINRFDENNVILVSKNNLVYFMVVPRDGIFEIDMSCSITNDSSMYAISNKRAKINLDSSLLWYCRIGHIGKKCIEKLQHDGLLDSIDIESLGKCVSCMSRKMARKPYSHQVERAKDLFGLIHTDVFQKEVENQLGKTIKSIGLIVEDYALETAARILNMVPTKKVDKTPYEIWHGQAPKLSYLKV